MGFVSYVFFEGNQFKSSGSVNLEQSIKDPKRKNFQDITACKPNPMIRAELKTIKDVLEHINSMDKKTIGYTTNVKLYLRNDYKDGSRSLRTLDVPKILNDDNYKTCTLETKVKNNDLIVIVKQ